MEEVAGTLKSIPDDEIDAEADTLIAKCVTSDPPKSFFLFAGAGSGKTESLVKALFKMKENMSDRLRLNGRSVGVITFTNKACNEIKHRLGYDDLFAVSTIHSFAWSMIKGLNHDIRAWLKINLQQEIEEIQEKERKGRPGTKASFIRQQDIAEKTERLNTLENIRKFRYNPDGDNAEFNALNHSEVIKISSTFFTEKPIMQSLLINRFPILLIDESQDTNKELIEALFHVQAEHKKKFSLGIIGDMMQMIYTAGKLDIASDLPADWVTPKKIMNHRSCHRIIRLINRIREPVDAQKQKARSDKDEGIVRFFIVPANSSEKPAQERTICTKMADITNDEGWLEPEKNVKTLILEHRMAANRLNFLPMWDALSRINRLQTGLRDGSLPALRFFSHLILPLVNAHKKGNRFEVASIVRKDSPLLDRNTLEERIDDQLDQMEMARNAVDSLSNLWDDGNTPTFLELLKTVYETGLFKIPETLRPYAKLAQDPDKEFEEDDDERNDEYEVWHEFLDTPFDQIERYSQYIQGEAQYDTHQGIKGLEFERVCVIMDDSEARGFMFSYDKLFGAKAETKKKDPTKETSIDRTRRLFYVTCSRAEESIALVAYTDKPHQVKDYVIKESWFQKQEIELIE